MPAHPRRTRTALPPVRRARQPGTGNGRRWGAALAAVVLLSGFGGAHLYRQLNGNITQVTLTDAQGNARSTGPEEPDPFAGALDILLIGSDSRAGAANCSLGGACGAERNADVQMLVHVAADRSNATVMSIPRDTMTQLPACRDRTTGRSVATRYGQINSALTYGPNCSLASVEQLTGVRIDHVAMIDFSGVIRMSDAVGGAEVCVTGDVYDPKSHLKLSAGRHTLTGEGALQFVRTRHAFGDGSDLGRTYAQQLYVGAVIRRLKSTGTLVNPVAVYSVAQEATKALTVDTGLASIPRLVRLAATLNGVPQERITFVTMQTSPDPTNPNRVVPAPAASALFAAIRADRPLSAAPRTGSPTPSADPSGTGTPSGSSPSPSASASPTPEALEGARASRADDDSSCAEVSDGYVISYLGRRLTPAQAYAAATAVPDSDAGS